jgi:hypothetical protein
VFRLFFNELQNTDGRIKHMHKRSETVYDGSGNPVKSYGTVQNITKLKQAKEELR